MNCKKLLSSIGLLPRILIAIVLGVVLGNCMSMAWIQVFTTFNSIFSQFLGFMIPLIIVGLVTPAIGDIGNKAGKLLLATVAIAYFDTILAGSLSYGVGEWLFPNMIEGQMAQTATEKAADIEPYFTLSIPPLFDVMSSLVLSFVV